MLPEPAVVGVRLEREGAGGIPAGARGQKGQLVLRGLRNGVNACPVLVEHLERSCGSGAEVVGSAGECDVELGLLAAGAEIAVDATQLRRRIIAPAVVVDGIGGEVGRQVSGLPSGLHRTGAPPERAAAQLGVGALVGKSVLHVDGERAPQGVEPVDRIAGHQRQAIDGSLRDEVPVDGIAKNLIDAHSVLIDGQPLRGANDRRGDEPTVVEVALELVAGLVAERDTGKTARYCIQQVGGFLMLEIGGPKASGRWRGPCRDRSSRDRQGPARLLGMQARAAAHETARRAGVAGGGVPALQLPGARPAEDWRAPAACWR